MGVGELLERSAERAEVVTMQILGKPSDPHHARGKDIGARKP